MNTAASHVMPTYNNLPVFFTHGEGIWLWDEAGRQYLDALAGIAVNTVGHRHPRLVAALQDQVGKLIHQSNIYKTRLQETLADQLIDRSAMTNAFFCNSGLEANEAAIKIARKYGHEKGIERPEIIVYDNAFHGRSLATLSATGNPKIQKDFGPLVEGFVRIPLNDPAQLATVAAERPNVVAVFIEAIQGEGGVNLVKPEYLQTLRQLCDQKKWLLMIDEVQCGMGRTGKWFAHQWAGIVPDVMPLAKGLASGVPIGAVLAHGPAARILTPGTHGSTFGGNPLACRAALETLSIIEDNDLMTNALQIGDHLRASFTQALAGAAGVVEIRGQGLMIGIELAYPCGTLVQQAFDAGLLINVTQERVIRLLPPLVIAKIEADQLVAGLAPLIRNFLSTKV